MIRQDLEVFGWIWGTLRPDLVAIVATPLAIVVTLHVLRHKRDVSAAIGWIGLAWFAPVFGAVLYFLFGISRVSRRAREARPEARPGEEGSARAVAAPDGFDPLRTAVGAIIALPLLPGNAVRVLRNGDDAFPEMLEAIARARTSVMLTTYILRADRIGKRFVDALAEAQGRGVSVRVLVDGVGSGYFLPGAYGALRRRGIPTARFMHSALPWRMPFLNLRSHKKLLVVDGARAFIGGLNIGDEDVLRRRPRPPYPVQDTHFAVTGPVTAQLAADFLRDWFFVTGEDLPTPEPKAGDAGDARARAIPSGPDEDIETIEFVVLQACACARRSIHLMTPYFLPSELVVNALAMAAMRGVTVNVLVPERSNHRLVDCASRAHVGPLLDRGVAIWLVPAPFDHSKLLAVDGAWSLIGSANMDTRSLRLNFELDLEVYDHALARTLTGFMEARMLRRLTKEALAQRSLPTVIGDAAVRLALPYL